MEQEINIKEQLAALIAAPEKISQNDAVMLRDIASRYPYFQPVHLLLAKANLKSAGENESIASAALYNNGIVLHKILYDAEYTRKADFNIVNYPSSGTFGNDPETLDEAVIDEVPAETDDQRITDEQEVFDEITEVNINEYRSAEPPEVISEDSSTAKEEDLVLENIVSTDFFAFQENFHVESAPEAIESQIEEYREEETAEEETIVISKYDDDQLPYTFLWWLAKTRKEHQQIFQPYASPRQVKQHQEPKTSNEQKTSELQQQYVENIFHMQSPFDEEDEYTATEFRERSKGNEIIENFIKNEPQISPPKPEQINNENKARKSAEDHNDLVSETLANIYIEQMLYDKAIETYEKLSLMFPEKSRYFADLIQSIEKKI